MPGLRLFCAALIALSSAACHIRHDQVRQQIGVSSTPPGAIIQQTDTTGTKSLGPAPVNASVEMVEERVDFDWASGILFPLISGGATAGSIAWAAQGDDAAVSIGIALAICSGLAFLMAVPMTIGAAVDDGELLRTWYVHGSPTFTAKRAGYSEASLVLTDGEAPLEQIDLQMHEVDKVEKVAVLGALRGDSLGIGGLLKKAAADAPIVAVMTVEDRSKALKTSQLDQLTEYLASKLVESKKYRVVPREELRQALGDLKRDSYKECIDERCQIELGKAVAAQMSLSTKLIRVGNQCALSATLYDLSTEATAAGASTRTDCTTEKMMDGVDELVSKLVN